MPRPAPLPDGLAHGPFSVTDARARGIQRSRLRARDLNSPFPGVRTVKVDAPLPTMAKHRATAIAALALAYATRMPPSQFFSHTTAAVLLGLRLPDGFREIDLQVTSAAPTRAPRGRGISGHQSGPGIRPVTLPSGLRVTSPIDTWVSLGDRLSVDELVIMADGLLRRKNPLATPDQLVAAIPIGGRGCRALRTALELSRTGTDSARETVLRLAIIRAGFPEPEVNGVILNRYGAEIAHGDLVFRAYRTILEYDGGQHREDDEQFRIDVERLDELMEEEWRVIRVDKFLLARRFRLVAKVRTALIRGGWREHPPAR